MVHPTKGALVLLLATAGSAAAQTRGFVVRLGVDTFAVERIIRKGARVEGAVVRHTPATTVLKYALALNPDGTVAWYQEGIFHADGTPVADARDGTAQTGMKMTFVGDTVIREVTQRGERKVKRNPAPRGTLPTVGGTSPYWQELVVGWARRAGAEQFRFFGFDLRQDSATVLGVRTIGPDSAEILAGGFRRGYKLDGHGQVTRGDASLTTVKLAISPIRDADIGAIATRWAAQDAAGRGMGVASTRDTVTAKVGDAAVWIDYGRPAKRGRRIWGQLVPWDTVWRFGANAAAQLKTDRDLTIGGTVVPAGLYSVWLLPSTGQSYLIVNQQAGQWGTVYDPSKDLVRIPIERFRGPPAGEERFRVMIKGDRLMMLWDDGGYEVRLSAP